MLDYLITAQTLPGSSPIRRLDPRTRLLGFAGLLVVFVAARRPLPAVLALTVTIALVALARVPLRFALGSVRSVAPWLALIAAVQVGFGVGDRPGCPPLWSWGPSLCVLEFALLTLLRFLGILLLMGLLVWTTPIPDLVRAIEALAMPLDRLGLPAHQVAMVGVIGVRFLPTMALELERLRKAQAARGGDIGGGTGFLSRVRRTLPLVVPLFILSLRRAERLAEAMEARAYGVGERRSHPLGLHFRPLDAVVLAGLAAFVVGMLIL
ncbi:MAG TPA: energy-coupling factor transporter transmembrane protein EcfT [Thermoflexia bacterium]|jgi:energy-coupling factor transport system permease protein|nr:energy-coupling factor transporter transmembrane protein EcfT [Thermoflexia bacterium]